jgi:glutaredoxin
MPGRLTVFTRPGCILCAQVREHLEAARLPFKEVQVTERSAQDELLQKAKVAGFPAIFLDEQYIGGFSHVVYLITQGRLRTLVDEKKPPG